MLEKIPSYARKSKDIIESLRPKKRAFTSVEAPFQYSIRHTSGLKPLTLKKSTEFKKW